MISKIGKKNAKPVPKTVMDTGYRQFADMLYGLNRETTASISTVQISAATNKLKSNKHTG